MPLVTDHELERYATLRDAEPDAQAQALGDAELAYAWLREHEWSEEGELREALRAHELGPDRITRALGVLTDAGRVRVVPEPTRAERPAERPRRPRSSAEEPVPPAPEPAASDPEPESTP